MDDVELPRKCTCTLCIPRRLRKRVLTATQTIFADKTYPKPFFLTYINTSLFTLPLVFILLARTWGLWRSNQLSRVKSFRSLLRHLDSSNPKAEEQRGILRAGSFDVVDDEGRGNHAIEDLPALAEEGDTKLGIRATARLSLQFCMLWVCISWIETFETIG